MDSPIFDAMFRGWLFANGFHPPRPSDRATEGTEFTRQNLTAGGLMDLDLRGATPDEAVAWFDKQAATVEPSRLKAAALAHCTLRRRDEVLLTEVRDVSETMSLALTFLTS